MEQRKIKLSEICDELKLHLVGEDITVDGLNLCNRKSIHNSILSYTTNDSYLENVKDNKSIKALVVNPNNMDKYSSLDDKRDISFVISDQPEKTFYDIHEWLVKKGFYESYTFDAKVGENCTIDDSAVIQNGVIIGNNVSIGPNSVIKRGTIIDDGVTIGCNTTIGSEGFQVIRLSSGKLIKVTHVGKCHICANAYIGDNSCVCNSLFEGETVIGEGSLVDNLVHVGHNCVVGSDSVITACVILCGSSTIEDNAWIGPNSSVLNKVVISSGTKVGLGSVVTRDTKPGTLVYGVPAKAK